VYDEPTVPVPAAELDAYLGEVFTNFLPPISSRDPALAERIKESLVRGMRRLNALPAGDAFWKDSNGAPTLAKMQVYCGRRLAKNPDDDEARWALYAYDVCLFAPHFGAPHLEPIVVKDLRQIRWLVQACDWVSTVSTGGKAELRKCVKRLRKAVPGFDAALQAFVDGDDPALGKAAQAVLQLGSR
jgi:hypothetical protein